MTRVNVLKFSVALSAAAATHLSVLAYTVSHAPPPLVAGDGFSVQFGSLASATNAGSLESIESEETDPAPHEQEQPRADHAPPEPQPPAETVETEPVQPIDPVSAPVVAEISPPPSKPDAPPEQTPQAGRIRTCCQGVHSHIGECAAGPPGNLLRIDGTGPG